MNLSVNYEELVVIARSLINKAGDFETLARDINNINKQIAEVWQGVDAAKYIEAVNIQNTYMMKLAEVIAEIGNYLNGVGAAYQEAATKNMSSINI